ncbi:hypothetical protein Tco_0808581 [Tanacetum coccineum]
MSITKEQQQALDDALVPQEQRLRIAFLISCSVPAIYMHEFWATVSYHKHCIKFKINKKNYSFDLETFRDMLQICPNLPGQKFEDPPFEEEILAFIRDSRTWLPLEISKSTPLIGVQELTMRDRCYQGMVIPKPKYVRHRSTREKTNQAPTASPGKRLKATTKVAKLGKKKLPTQGLETLSEIALFEAQQIKIVTKRSKTQFHSSHASGSGADKETSVSPGVPDVPTYGYEDEQISWKSSDEDDDDEVSLSKDYDDNADNEDDDGQDDDNEQTKLDNDDLRVQPPSHFESTDDKAYDEVTQGDNVEGEELNEEETNEKDEVNKLYKDVKVNLERRDTEMTDANVQATQVKEDTQAIITAISPEVQ